MTIVLTLQVGGTAKVPSVEWVAHIDHSTVAIKTYGNDVIMTRAVARIEAAADDYDQYVANWLHGVDDARR